VNGILSESQNSLKTLKHTEKSLLHQKLLFSVSSVFSVTSVIQTKDMYTPFTPLIFL